MDVQIQPPTMADVLWNSVSAVDSADKLLLGSYPDTQFQPALVKVQGAKGFLARPEAWRAKLLIRMSLRQA